MANFQTTTRLEIGAVLIFILGSTTSAHGHGGHPSAAPVGDRSASLPAPAFVPAAQNHASSFIRPQAMSLRGGRLSGFGSFGGGAAFGFPYYSAYNNGYGYGYGGMGDFDFPASFGPPRLFAELPPLPNDHPLTARLLLQVPVGAEVWLQGRKYDVGPIHIFESPELKPGETYRFDVRVTWQEKGKKVEEKRVLTMKAGDFQNLQYISLTPAPPPPKKVEKLITSISGERR